MNDKLQKMNELGQAPWVDELSRDDIQNGGLEQMIEEGIVGVTSNPAIFQKAIGDSDLYDDQLQELAEKDGRSEGDLLGDRQAGHPGRLRHLHARLRQDRRVRTVGSPWKSSRTSPSTPTRP